MKTKYFLFGAIACVLVNCSKSAPGTSAMLKVTAIAGPSIEQSDNEASLDRQVKLLGELSPEDCATDCIKNNKRVLLGCRSYTVKIPGWPDAESTNNFTILIINGTADNITTDGQKEINVLAHDFAKKFNIVIRSAYPKFQN